MEELIKRINETQAKIDCLEDEVLQLLDSVLALADTPEKCQDMMARLNSGVLKLFLADKRRTLLGAQL